MTAFPEKNFKKLEDGRWININQIVSIKRSLPNIKGQGSPSSLWHEDYRYYAYMANHSRVLLFSTLDKETALDFEEEIMGFEHNLP